MAKGFRKNGVIIWEGASLIDGSPIVVIATGFTKKSDNEKTGNMIQTFILRSDMHPSEAVKTGADVANCGDCKHRPSLGGACYVRVSNAPGAVWRCFERGGYRRAERAELAALFAGRPVRLGTYGDPAAAPFAMWQAVASQAAFTTGYTHQWRAAQNAPFATILMASADTLAEGVEARAQGFRTFRVRVASETVAPKVEFICPASKEAGYKTNCAACKACGGLDSRAKASPVIIVHGAKARRFELTRSRAA
jgi:hypothetical protein